MKLRLDRMTVFELAEHTLRMTDTTMHASVSDLMIAAPPWRRIAAYFVDYLVFMLPLLGVLSLGSWALLSLGISPFSDNVWLNQGIVILVLTVPVVLYFALSEASRSQATIGKRLLKVSVVDVNGHRVTLKQAMLRAIIKFLPWEFFHTIYWRWEGFPINPAPPTTLQLIGMTIGWLVIGWFVVCLCVGSRRTPYDWAAGTTVVKKLGSAARTGE